MTAVDNPTTRPGYKPVQMPMPAAQPAAYNPNSLWRNGSRAFFKDQRAHQMGDILTVKVNITDKANIENETKRTRTMTEDFGIANFFGKPKVPIMNTPVPTRIFTADSKHDGQWQGFGRSHGRAQNERRRRGDASIAERQSGDRGQAGNPRQLRGSRTDRRWHCATGGYRERQHDRLRTRSRRRVSRMEAAARLPTCSRAAMASRSSTYSCRSSQSRSVPGSRAVSHRASANGVNDAVSGCSPAGGRVFSCWLNDLKKLPGR